MNEKKLISDIKKTAEGNNIKLLFSKDSLVYGEGETIGCAGYFDSDSMTLAVANNPNKELWLGLLAHESSHMDQFIDDRYLWDKCLPGYSLFFEWLDGKKIVKQEVLNECVQDIIRLEKDCEVRAIKKIKKYNLSIDLDNYRRKCNSYLFAYLFFQEKKKWVPKIYDADYVWGVAPIRFKKDYNKIPDKLHKAFNRKLKSLAI